MDGVVPEGACEPGADHLGRRTLTWLLHLVFQSNCPVDLDVVHGEVTFLREGAVVTRRVYERMYLASMEWIRGKFELNTQYYLANVRFGAETRCQPRIPAGEAVSLVRVPLTLPFFAWADTVALEFDFVASDGARTSTTHRVDLTTHEQTVRLRLPYDGTSLVVKGNDLGPVSHRWTGLNGVTTYGWDFMKVEDAGAIVGHGSHGREGRSLGGAPVLAVADGRVAHARNDIELEWDEATPDMLERDGDILAGNLVVLDHGNSEFTLTSHLATGTVDVTVGDVVAAGDEIGRTGPRGCVHVNLMDNSDWLAAAGLPAVVSEFEHLMPPKPPETAAKGNPRTGWLVRPA